MIDTKQLQDQNITVIPIHISFVNHIQFSLEWLLNWTCKKTPQP